jgi:hypothetical protein
MALLGRGADDQPTRKATDICVLRASWNLNRVLGFRMTASLGSRLAGTNNDPRPKNEAIE